MANQFVAYQDERHGLGAWVAEQIAASLFRYGVWTDADGKPVLDDEGQPATRATQPAPHTRVAAAYGMSLATAGTHDTGVLEQPKKADDGLNFAYRTWVSPRASADSTFSAVISQQAQVGVVPLFDNDFSFNRDTLGALLDFPQNNVLREYVAESNYVLAAPTDLIHEIEQSGFTDSFAPSGSSSSFTWNREKQQRYLRKVTTVYASAEAMRHCGPAIDGFRARGIDVQQIPDGTDSYREGLNVAMQLLDPNRRVETRFSGKKHERVSRSTGANHTKPLIAVLLSGDKAAKPDGYHYDSDYVILEAEMAGAERINTSFLAMTRGAPSSLPSNFPLEPVRDYFNIEFEMQALKRHFRPGPAKATPKGEIALPVETPNYVRCLYKFNTVGKGSKDYSKVFKMLRRQGFSFQTTTLDDRPGHPMVLAVDVPAARYRAMRPVLRAIVKLQAIRRMADFPALRPMVPEAMSGADHSSWAWKGLGAIAIALIAFVLLRL